MTQKREGKTLTREREQTKKALVKIQQQRLSFPACKHVRYVLEEDTKDDSRSSSFGPEHSSGPAHFPNQPVPAAAISAVEVSQQLAACASTSPSKAHADDVKVVDVSCRC